MSCEYWDCGWCYHPSNKYKDGCVGTSTCMLLEKKMTVQEIRIQETSDRVNRAAEALLIPVIDKALEILNREINKREKK